MPVFFKNILDGALKLVNFIISEPLSIPCVLMLCDSRKHDGLYMFHYMLNHNSHSKKSVLATILVGR